MNKILQVVSSFGDYERVAQGVFENYPLLKVRDSTFEGISKCMEWFIFSDVLSKQIYTLQNYSISSYLQYAFVVWHFVFATHMKQKLSYPSVGYEVSKMYFMCCVCGFNFFYCSVVLWYVSYLTVVVYGLLVYYIDGISRVAYFGITAICLQET